ncbi:MAG: hypothetical protein AAF532_06145 [Planctomycetota bacterium]
MPDLVPLAFGGGVLAFAVLMGGFEILSTPADGGPPNEDDAEFFAKRRRRRTQVAVMLAVVGVAIPLGDWAFDGRNAPFAFTIYWLTVLLVVLWVIAIGLLDLAATRIHTRIQLRKLDRKKNELASRLAAMRDEPEPETDY